MKNKRNTYLLIGLTLLIWGYLGWQLLNAVTEKQDIPISNTPIVLADNIMDSDSFGLILEYRDPFLGKFRKEPKSKPKPGKTKLSQPRVKKIETKVSKVTFPPLIYKGSFTNGKEVTAIIQLNGQEHMLRRGDQLSGIQIEQIDNDSILVEYKSQRKKYGRTF